MGVATCKPLEFGALALVAMGCADPWGATLDRQRLEGRVSYRLGVPPLIWGGERRLVASDAAEFDQFGYAVSLSESHALLGAYGDGSYTGAAYFFASSGSDFVEEQRLVAGDGSLGGQFGWSVSLFGDRALLGAPGAESSRGAAYVFVRNGSSWTEEQKLVASDGFEGDQLGWSVSLAEERALLGAPGAEASRGAAYVFVRSGDAWTEEQRVVASDGAEEDRLGWSVALAGDLALAGVPGNDNARGAALAFVRTDDSWSEEQELVASDAMAGDEFGVSVSLRAERALVGSYWDDSLRGAAYIFYRSDSSWSEEQKLVASDGAEGDRFGISASLTEDCALIGAYANDNGRGAAYVFVRNESSWSEEQKLVVGSAAENNLFGWSVSLGNDRALVGAHYDDNLRGAAYAFSLGLQNGVACSAAADCASGHCIDDVCCDIDCAGACAGCSVAEGAAVEGSCTVFAAGSEGRPACGSLGCNGQSMECTPCESDEDCPGMAFCAADQTCQPRLEQGEACNDWQGGDCHLESCRACQSGFCDTGVCCERQCTPAEACTSVLKIAGADGTCGEAKTAVDGSFCASDEACTSGYCVDGVCCDTDCAGTCQACTAALKGSGEDGTCGYVAAGLNPGTSSSDSDADCGELGACSGAVSCDGRGGCECVSDPVDAGCACRASGSAGHDAGAWFGVALWVLLSGRRRRLAPAEGDPSRRTAAFRAGRGWRKRR